MQGQITYTIFPNPNNISRRKTKKVSISLLNEVSNDRKSKWQQVKKQSGKLLK